MAGQDMMTNAGVASLAYNDALMQARTAQDSLLRGYGFVSADAGGNYTTESAQSAFDPRVLFRDAAPSADQLSSMVKNLRVGGTGKIADTMRSGATAQSDITESAAHSGLSEQSGVGGGIIQQRRDLAAHQSEQGVNADKLKFLTGEASAFAPIGAAQMDLKKAGLYDRLLSSISMADIRSYLPNNGRGVRQNGGR
jgi:L-alanine-DL-glutamate epimerase-like enolase superfamily enzyme